MSSMLARCVNDKLTEATYSAALAGLSYNVSVSGRGLSVSLGGFSDKLLNLLDTVLDCLVSARFEEHRWDMLLNKYIRALKNHSKAQAHALADRYVAGSIKMFNVYEALSSSHPGLLIGGV